MAAFTYVFMLLALVLAVYINYPAPTHMSTNLVAWKTTASKTIIFNKMRVFYKDEPGTKTVAPVLVCLHGFPTSSYDWLKVWPALLHKFSRVIAPDFLGFGFSDKPVDHEYSITEQADLVEHILHYQRVKEVHLLAHDYGDTVAQELLARYEDRLKEGTPKLIIKSVCLLNGGIFPETNFPRVMQQALLMPYVGPILSRLSNIYSFQRGFGEVFGPRTQPTDPEYHDFWALIRKNEGNLVMSQLLQYIPERAANKYRWTGVLQKTKVPVHVVYGPADPVNPPGFVDFYKEVIPEPSITVLEGHIGHYPQWEDSAECMSAYFTFLKKLPFIGDEVRPQPTPNVTVLHKKTGKLPPPKVVLEKMKAREEQALRDAGKPEAQEQVKKEGEKPASKPPQTQKSDANEQAEKLPEQVKDKIDVEAKDGDVPESKEPATGGDSQPGAKPKPTVKAKKVDVKTKKDDVQSKKDDAQTKKDDVQIKKDGVKTKKDDVQTKKQGAEKTEDKAVKQNAKAETVTDQKSEQAEASTADTGADPGKTKAEKPATKPDSSLHQKPSSQKPGKKATQVKSENKVKPEKPIVKDDVKTNDDVKTKVDNKDKNKNKMGG